MGNGKISVVVVCRNEAAKLDRCLASVASLAFEIVVVDLDSTDNLPEVAKKYHAKVYRHPIVDVVEKVRNFGISKAQGEWILVLDPDEVIAVELSPYLLITVAQNNCAAVNIPRKNVFFGKWVRHSNFWPDRQIRFFKKDNISWPETIHAYPKISGLVVQSPLDPEVSIIHYGYDSWEEFFDRQNRYSSVFAQQQFALGVRFSWVNFCWLPIREWLVRYVKHGGFLDGFLGFSLAYGLSIYQISAQIKLWLLSQKTI